MLHQVVREHLETFLAATRHADPNGLPTFLEHEFRAFLDCGVWSRGFARFQCGCHLDLPLGLGRCTLSSFRGEPPHAISDAAATEQTIQKLMGKEVAPRVELIMGRAPKVDEIDVS